MTEKELSELGLLEEFSITELEQRLEFEAWCDGNCSCEPSNGTCNPGPIDGGCPEVPLNVRCPEMPI